MSDLRSALIVAVPEAAPAVDGWRERTCYAKPSSGVPAHVTLLFPFVPAAKIDDALIECLRTVIRRFEAFTFELRATKRFPAVTYLAPEPPDRFAHLTEALVLEFPDFPPYEGAFDSIVPHLTVAEGEPQLLDEVEGDVRRFLPISAQARDVILLEEVEPDSVLWRTRARLPLTGA